MKGLLLRDKKAVSIMIGYVLLVVIAIAISVMVFAYLKLYLPLNEPRCYDDVAISIDKVSCSNGEVDLTLTNRGLFNINGAFIRIGEKGRIYKEVLNPNQPETLFASGGNTVLAPGATWSSTPYSYSEIGSQILEVEPLLFIDDKPTLCENAVVKTEVFC